MTTAWNPGLDRRPRCEQPACLLKHGQLNAERLAEYLVQMLAGSTPNAIQPDSECICPRPACTSCALSAIQGGRTYFTDSEWRHLDELGQWHHRRHRRKTRQRQ